MLSFKQFILEIKKSTSDLKDTCWKGYVAIGTKKKNNKTVPNCIPEEYISEERTYLNRPELETHIGKLGMRSIMNHPFFQQHVVGTGNEPKFTHSKITDSHSTVESISTPTRFVSFDMTGYGKRKKVGNAHLFTWDGKSRGFNGSKLWVHTKSFHEDE